MRAGWRSSSRITSSTAVAYSTTVARRRRRCQAATRSARSSITSQPARRSRTATASCTASRVTNTRPEDHQVPEQQGNINCKLNRLSRSPPPLLPGGYTVGEKLYFTEDSQTVSTGDRLVHGEQGEVMPGTSNQGCLEIKFSNNKRVISCTLNSALTAAAGYTVGEKIYYLGASR